jgi:hypothetical protein
VIKNDRICSTVQLVLQYTVSLWKYAQTEEEAFLHLRHFKRMYQSSIVSYQIKRNYSGRACLQLHGRLCLACLCLARQNQRTFFFRPSFYYFISLCAIEQPRERAPLLLYLPVGETVVFRFYRPFTAQDKNLIRGCA